MYSSECIRLLLDLLLAYGTAVYVPEPLLHAVFVIRVTAGKGAHLFALLKVAKADGARGFLIVIFPHLVVFVGPGWYGCKSLFACLTIRATISKSSKEAFIVHALSTLEAATAHEEAQKIVERDRFSSMHSDSSPMSEFGTTPSIALLLHRSS